MLSSKNKTNYETYIKLLKDENEKLYRKIPQLQKDLDHAIAAKEKSSALLNKYNEIMEIISYLPSDDSDILKSTTSFLKIYNEIFNTPNKTKNLEHCTIQS